VVNIRVWNFNICGFQNCTFAQMSLLVIGSVAFDAIETPFGKTDKIIGGAATYIALSSSYLAEQVNLVAVVGGDFPKEDITLLQNHGVDTEGLQVKEDEK
jgi:sugar/nucleoside kinase (ribokinase family)